MQLRDRGTARQKHVSGLRLVEVRRLFTRREDAVSSADKRPMVEAAKATGVLDKVRLVIQNEAARGGVAA